MTHMKEEDKKVLKRVCLLGIVVAVLLALAVGASASPNKSVTCVHRSNPTYVNCFIPTGGTVTSGSIYWSNEWWTVHTWGGATAEVTGSGELKLIAQGGAGNPCQRVSSVDVISHKEAEFGGIHTTYSFWGGEYINILEAPLWVAPVPWSENGEVDIEHATPGSCYHLESTNYQYSVWARNSCPNCWHEWWRQFNNPYGGRLTSNKMWLGTSNPNYVGFGTYYWDRGRPAWMTVQEALYNGPGVSLPSDHVHVWISKYAFAPSTTSFPMWLMYYEFMHD